MCKFCRLWSVVAHTLLLVIDGLGLCLMFMEFARFWPSMIRGRYCLLKDKHRLSHTMSTGLKPPKLPRDICFKTSYCLGIRWHHFARNSKVFVRAGLVTVSDWIMRGRSAIFGHVAHQAMLCQIEPSVDFQILHGSVSQVYHMPSGPTNSAAVITMHPLQLVRAIGRGHSRPMLWSEPSTH